MLACLALTIAISAATYLLIEWPGLKFLRRALKRALLRQPVAKALGAAD